MNTKIIAILMASIVAISIVAMAVPAMGNNAVGEAVVNNAPPYICAKWEEPDDQPVTLDTTEVMPNPAAVKPVTIKACVCDCNGDADIASVTADVTGPTGFTPIVGMSLTRHPETDTKCEGYTCVPNPGYYCWQYDGTFNMDPGDPAGMYTVTVTIVDQSGATNTTMNTFEYLPLMAISLSFDKVVFTGKPCEIVTGAESIGGTPVASTIHNDGNEPIDIGVLSSDLTYDASNIIDGENVTANLNNIGNSTTQPEYIWDTNLVYDETIPIDFYMHIPHVKPYTYTGGITITPYAASTKP